MKKSIKCLILFLISLFAIPTSSLQTSGYAAEWSVVEEASAKSESSTISCATGGYGEISSITGRPKTVHVKGHYRKDGTYVQSHYRAHQEEKKWRSYFINQRWRKP